METVEQLNTYSSEEFEAWLEMRLSAQYDPDPDIRYRAFDFRELEIPFGESHIDRLVLLFKRLSVEAQLRFRDATERLLRHAEPNDFSSEAMDDLVFIIGLIKAYGSLKAFVPVFGHGSWGELHQYLIYDALSVLLMFDHTTEAYEAAKSLATSANFPDTYLFDAYLVLVRSRPDNWSSDLALLRERFCRLQRTIHSTGDPAQLERLATRERDLAAALVQSIPLSELAQQFPNLRLIPSEARDSWLVDNIFKPPALLRLEYSSDGNSLRLIDESDNARQGFVPSVPEFEVFCIARGHLFDDRFLRSSEAHVSPEIQVRLDNCSRAPQHVANGTPDCSKQ